MISAGLTVLVQKEDKTIFQSTEPMLRPLLLCLRNHRAEMKDASVIDRVVGKAAAYLCILGQVKEVITPLASQSAHQVLQEHHISLKALKTVPQIRNRDNTDQCPMEKLADSCATPEEFLRALEKRT